MLLLVGGKKVLHFTYRFLQVITSGQKYQSKMIRFGPIKGAAVHQ